MYIFDQSMLTFVVSSRLLVHFRLAISGPTATFERKMRNETFLYLNFRRLISCQKGQQDHLDNFTTIARWATLRFSRALFEYLVCFFLFFFLQKKEAYDDFDLSVRSERTRRKC